MLLRLGLLAAGHTNDQIQQIFCSLVDALLAVSDDAGVEVDPAGLLLRQRGVGGDLQSGSRSRERSAAAGGEQDQGIIVSDQITSRTQACFSQRRLPV